MLGVAARHGRLFTEAEDHTASPLVPVVISEALWTRWFDRDPAVVGTAITASGLPMSVVGVAPDAFAPWRTPADIWIPFRHTPSLLRPEVLQSLGYQVLQVVARLAPGVTPEQAQAQIAGIDVRLHAEVGDTAPGNLHVLPIRKTSVDARIAHSLWLVGATAMVLLLLVSTNVAD